MKNIDLLTQKLESSLTFLYEQEEKLRPIYARLQDILSKELLESNISVKEVFDMFIAVQEQYTNSILLITKIKEIIDFRD